MMASEQIEEACVAKRRSTVAKPLAEMRPRSTDPREVFKVLELLQGYGNAGPKKEGTICRGRQVVREPDEVRELDQLAGSYDTTKLPPETKIGVFFVTREALYSTYENHAEAR
jgi:hypothetical protein